LLKNFNIYTDTIQVFSPKSTSRIAELLDSVVSKNGSGYRAQISGHSVAGKTGTAELLVDGKYNKQGKKRTFFVGFTPVQKPKYIMAVRLEYPKKCYSFWDKHKRSPCQGSNSAAMVFQVAMRNVLEQDQRDSQQK